MSDEAPSDEGHPRRWFILAIMGLSLIVVMLNNVTLNVALPELSKDLGPTTLICSGFWTHMRWSSAAHS